MAKAETGTIFALLLFTALLLIKCKTKTVLPAKDAGDGELFPPDDFESLGHCRQFEGQCGAHAELAGVLTRVLQIPAMRRMK